MVCINNIGLVDVFTVSVSCDHGTNQRALYMCKGPVCLFEKKKNQMCTIYIRKAKYVAMQVKVRLIKQSLFTGRQYLPYTSAA